MIFMSLWEHLLLQSRQRGRVLPRQSRAETPLQPFGVFFMMGRISSLGQFVQFNLRLLSNNAWWRGDTDHQLVKHCWSHRDWWMFLFTVWKFGKIHLALRSERVAFSRSAICILCENTHGQSIFFHAIYGEERCNRPWNRLRAERGENVL